MKPQEIFDKLEVLAGRKSALLKELSASMALREFLPNLPTPTPIRMRSKHPHNRESYIVTIDGKEYKGTEIPDATWDHLETITKKRHA